MSWSFSVYSDYEKSCLKQVLFWTRLGKYLELQLLNHIIIIYLGLEAVTKLLSKWLQTEVPITPSLDSIICQNGPQNPGNHWLRLTSLSCNKGRDSSQQNEILPTHIDMFYETFMLNMLMCEKLFFVWFLNLLNPFTHFSHPHPPIPISGNHQSLRAWLLFFDFMYKRTYIISLFLWLSSLYTIASGSTHNI